MPGSDELEWLWREVAVGDIIPFAEFPRTYDEKHTLVVFCFIEPHSWQIDRDIPARTRYVEVMYRRIPEGWERIS